VVVNSMTLSDLEASLQKSVPPAGFSPALAALWWARKDNWDKAHRIVMDEAGKDCAWVHAYLHRVEGDLDNARLLVSPGGALAAGERAVRGMDRHRPLAASVADLTFLPALPRVLRRNVKSKATLASNSC
jgi:hypothetical protein